MSAYVCAELVNGVCSVWIEQSPLLPPLDISGGLSLGWSIVACYAAAWGMGLLTRFLLSHERN